MQGYPINFEDLQSNHHQTDTIRDDKHHVDVPQYHLSPPPSPQTASVPKTPSDKSKFTIFLLPVSIHTK